MSVRERPGEERPGVAPELSAEEEAKAEESASLSADATHEVIRHEGEEELRRSSSGLAWSGLAAGLSMGFSLVAEALLHAHLPDAPWRPLVVGFGYSVGFLIVILASQQLFTENTLTAIVPLLTRRDGKTLRQVARLWTVVLLANLLGGLLFALVLARTDLFAPDIHHALSELSRRAVETDFGTSVLRAIFAGWLIALLVWMLPAAKGMDVVVIVLVTYVVSLGKFLHIVAGAVEVFYLAATGELPWGDTVTRFLAPALLGNVIGGVVMASALNHAQVVSGGGKSG